MEDNTSACHDWLVHRFSDVDHRPGRQQKWPAEVDIDIVDWVQSIVVDVSDAVGAELVGVYLHGSLAMGYYRPKSDLDLLIVCSGPLDVVDRERVARALLAASERRPTIGELEASVLQIGDTRAFTHPMPYEVHFGESVAEEIRQGRLDYAHTRFDADLAAHCTVVRSRGLRLVGDDIGEVFGPVPSEAYVDSIREDLHWILDGENLLTSPFYGVLNTCRVLMVLEHGPEVVPSKEDAALWTLGWVPSEHQALIQQWVADLWGRPVMAYVSDESAVAGACRQAVVAATGAEAAWRLTPDVVIGPRAGVDGGLYRDMYDRTGR